MYKLLIAEDEALAREAILKMIDFQSQGFEVVSVCEDGQQAVEQYQALVPDLVITDICMPFVSGLQLATMIAEADHGTQVIILTGYDDFNYAKQAIKSRVANYVLKPVTPSEFIAVLTEARQKLDEQHARQQQILKAERQLYISSPIVRDQVLNRLVQGAADSSEIDIELTQFGITETSGNYLVAIVQVEDLQTACQNLRVNTQLLQFMVANVAAELTQAHPDFLSFQLTDGRTALLGAMRDPQALSQQMLDLGRQIRGTIRQVLNISLIVGIGSTAAAPDLLPESFKAAQRSLDHRILMPTQAVISPEDIRKQAKTIDLTDLENKIILQVRLRDEAKLNEAIDQYVQSIRVSTLSKPDIQFEWNRLAGRLATAVSSEAGGQETALDRTLPVIEDSSSLDRLKVWLRDYCQACIRMLNKRRGSETQRLSAMACQYIQEHSDNSRLSLMEVCNHTAVSLSHFSLLFKEETGRTFVEYLTEIRMEKAKELLRNSDQMLYEIAEKVGYENPAYFTVAFKKHVGISPREYRKQFGQGG